MSKVLEADALCELANKLYESMLKEKETDPMRYDGGMHYHYSQFEDAIAAVDLVKADKSIMMLRYIILEARVRKCRYLHEEDASLVSDIKELIELYPEHETFITQLLTELSTLGEEEDDDDEDDEDEDDDYDYDEDDEDEDEDEDDEDAKN